MSAFVVSKKHIDYLVSAVDLWRMAPSVFDGTGTGRMLWAENVASVGCAKRAGHVQL